MGASLNQHTTSPHSPSMQAGDCSSSLTMTSKEQQCLPITSRLTAALRWQVAGAKALRDYALEHEVATGGLNSLWKIFSARSRKEGAPHGPA